MTLRTRFLAACSQDDLGGTRLRRPPFITDDPEPVELGHWEVYGFPMAATAMRLIGPGTQP